MNHWFSPENSSDPELDRGPTGADTPHNLVTSITWNLPGSGPVLSGWRLSSVSHHQSGSPYTIRYAGDPTGGGLTGGCSNRGCQSSQPGARNTERGKFINYADITLARTFAVGPDKIEIRADMFNAFNNQNLLAGGYIGARRQPKVRRAHGGVERLSRAPVPVRGDISVLRVDSAPGSSQALSDESGSVDCDSCVCGRSAPAADAVRHAETIDRCGHADLLVAADTVGAQLSGKPVRVRVQTELGDIVVEVDQARAPVTAANFLKYVDAGHYDGGDLASHRQDGQPAGEHDQDRSDPGRRESRSGQERVFRRSRSSAPT